MATSLVCFLTMFFQADESLRPIDSVDIWSAVASAKGMLKNDADDALLADICCIEIAGGHSSDAVDTAKSISSKVWRECSLGAVAYGRAVDGDVTTALDLAKELPCSDDIIRKIVSCRTRRGDFVGAGKALNEIKDPHVRFVTLLAFARMRLAVGDKDTGRLLVDEAARLSIFKDAETEKLLAIAYIESGQVELAEVHIKEVLSLLAGNDDDRIVAEIATAESKAGHMERSLTLAATIENAINRCDAMHSLAFVCLERNDVQYAARIAAQMANDHAWCHDRILCGIIRHKLKQRDLSNALQISNDVTSWDDRTEIKIAIGLMEWQVKGNASLMIIDACRRFLIEFHPESAYDEIRRIELLARVAQAQCELGQRQNAQATITDALALACKVDRPGRVGFDGFGSYWREIVAARRMLGDENGVQQALETAYSELRGQTAVSPLNRGASYNWILTEFIRIGDLKRALQIARNAATVTGSPIEKVLFSDIAFEIGKVKGIETVLRDVMPEAPQDEKTRVLVFGILGAFKPKALLDEIRQEALND